MTTPRLAVIALWALAACDHPAAPGQACATAELPADEAACLDAGLAVVCEAETLVAVPCPGPHGCQGRRGRFDAVCDVSSDGGARCPRAYEGTARCDHEGRALLVCQADAGGDPRYVRVPCDGPEGCRDLPGRVQCDQRKARVGTACSVQITGKRSSCAPGGHELLRCEGEPPRWALARACDGERGCRADNGPEARCDSSVAEPGARCEGDQVACAQGGKHLLRCDNGALVEGRVCGGDGCTIDWLDAAHFTVSCP